MPVIPSRKKKAVKTAVKKPEPKKAKKLSSVAVTMVVDESGSMGHLAKATCAGFNEYVDTLKKSMAEQTVFFSAMTFDTGQHQFVRKLQVGADLKDAIKLSSENYKPNGGTPLFDAIGEAVALNDMIVASKKIIVIQTDGEENSSRKVTTLNQVKAMIEDRQAKGWEFVFIGAGINAFTAGTSMGFYGVNTMSYQANEHSTRGMFAATAQNTQAYAAGTTGGMAYTGQQSAAVGESADILRQKMNHNPLGKFNGVNISIKS